ncbi:MAG: 5'-methylthioadenosine/adenosylhomocysteine nucleosidase [Lachnospiraceae bacterium]|nr:5'-methylthioadenosine/adenosylhomocysteine nucleosidase [Lachnospiraceae bacterium]
MLGIIGAMDEEVAKLKENMEQVEVRTKASMDFYRGVIGGKEVVVVRSGIGKVNAGICAQILADDYGVDGIVNTGIAGSLRAEINIGDIVVSTDAVQHDMDAVAFGYPLGQIPRMDTLAFHADSQLVELAVQCCKKVIPEIGVFQGRVASGDEFIAKKERKDAILKEFDACCCEMEGAAIAQAAYLNQIPFVIIRAISDKADDSAGMDYPTFEAMAIKNSVKLIMEMVVNV